MAECDHTITPEGYVAYHEWAEKKRAAGWTQKKCPNCKRWAIWVPPQRSIAEGEHKGSTQNF